ncbi:MAG TPA: DUF1501 domain-containing protein [Blastocatellia bacterium]|nr:DUF1501 domain-containing protein [Blastocatellia bacterium]
MTNHLEYGHECDVCKPMRPANSPLTGPMFGRRNFFKLAGAGVAGYFLTPTLNTEVVAKAAPEAQLYATARNCILVFLNGAPSHVDTFDLKVGTWTPADFNPTTYNGVLFPQGLMPNLATKLDQLAIIRSLRAPALVHSLQQQWVQIARSPATQLGKIAPHIGSVVSMEFEAQRRADQKLPVFISLNGNPQAGPGYFNGRHAAFNVNASPNGLSSLSNSDGQARFETRYRMLMSLEGNLRGNSFIGNEVTTMSDFYERGKGMMYNPTVDAVFKFTTTDQQRYGNNGFGNSCIVARNLVKADAGTRFIQLNLGGWDHHSNIYAATGGIYGTCRSLDVGLSNLLTDLATTAGVNGGTLLDETLIVMVGEFGRTTGALNNQAGRDHYFQHFAVLAGGGVKGGRVIGSTTDDGRMVKEPGWSQNRPVANEDLAATIYSALGINYLTIRRDDPFGRGFEYVPFANDGYWKPVMEVLERSAATRPRAIGAAPTGRRGGDQIR